MSLKFENIDVEKFIEGLHEYMGKEIVAPLVKRLKDLEEQVKELQERGALKYCGTYVKGTNYGKGDAITYGGSLWVALKQATAEPPGPDWALAAKRGRDAK